MSGRWVTKHTCDGNGPFPCDDRCRKWVEDAPVSAPVDEVGPAARIARAALAATTTQEPA